MNGNNNFVLIQGYFWYGSFWDYWILFYFIYAVRYFFADDYNRPYQVRIGDCVL